MTFRVVLDVQGKVLPANGLLGLDTADTGFFDSDLIDVLAGQCRAIAATNAYRFHVSGFGQERWPVDVETDLAIVIEQLPSVLMGLATEGATLELNFYEQGIERYITGVKRGQMVIFECASSSLNWGPEPSTELAPLAEAEQMFRALRDKYISAVDSICPRLANVRAFRRWKVSCTS